MEVWKDIAGFEGIYQVSNMGNVRSVTRQIECSNSIRTYKGKVLSAGIDNHGYARVILSVAQKHTTRQVHRLVAEAFLENPNNLPEVNHKDENPLNCCVDNLEWCTKQYNLAYGTGMQRSQQSHRKAVIQFDLDGNSLEEHAGVNKAAQAIGKPNDAAAITKCCKGKFGTAYGYIWRYKEVT